MDLREKGEVGKEKESGCERGRKSKGRTGAVGRGGEILGAGGGDGDNRPAFSPGFGLKPVKLLMY